MQLGYVIFTVHQVNVQTLYRQRGNSIEVRRHVVEIGGQQELHLSCQRLIGGLEGVQPRLRQLQHQRGLVDLYPLDAAFCQLGQHLLVDRQNIIQQAEAVKRFAFYLTQPQVRYRPQQDGFDPVTQRQRLVHFVQ